MIFRESRGIKSWSRFARIQRDFFYSRDNYTVEPFAHAVSRYIRHTRQTRFSFLPADFSVLAETEINQTARTQDCREYFKSRDLRGILRSRSRISLALRKQRLFVSRIATLVYLACFLDDVSRLAVVNS